MFIKKKYLMAKCLCSHLPCIEPRGSVQVQVRVVMRGHLNIVTDRHSKRRGCKALSRRGDILGWPDTSHCVPGHALQRRYCHVTVTNSQL